MIALKRVYDAAGPHDGARYLVERLRPRAVKKTALPVGAWLKDVVPSVALQRWFGHEPETWEESRRRYFR